MANFKHGHSDTAEYKIWCGIKTRCYNPNYNNHENYGGRGIVMCERWFNSFEAFYADLGPRPGPEYSIERRQVNGNYEPGNCYWTTVDVQANNRTDNVFYEIDGKKLTQAQLARSVGLTPSTLNIRIHKGGMSVEAAVTTPLLKVRNEKFTFQGKDLTLREWSQETGLSYRCIRDRIKTLGWSVEKALGTKVGDTPKSHSMRDSKIA